MKRWSIVRLGAFALASSLALLPAGAAAQGYTVTSTLNGSSAQSASGPYITATGVATVPGGSASTSTQPQTLNVGVQVRVQGSDLKSGVKQANQKLDAIEAALENAGVAQSAIRLQNFNISPQYGPPVIYAKGGPAPVPAAVVGGGGGSSVPAVPTPSSAPIPPHATEYMVDENVQVSVSGLAHLASAMSAAIAAGATSVNTYTPCCYQNSSPPSGSAMGTAISQATDQAKAEAQAAAQAAGVTLGSLHFLTVQPPFQQGPFGPDTQPSWRVQATVRYAITS